MPSRPPVLRSSRSLARAASRQNPFVLSGTVTGADFADREVECARVREALTTPQHFLLLYGPRRMGKTSILRVVQEEIRTSGGHVVLADFSTASSVTDLTSRLLRAVATDIGRHLPDIAIDLLKRLRFDITIEMDPASGLPVPKIGAKLREASTDIQRASLIETLDAIERLAAAHRTRIGLVLDEFQDIHRFGGVTAEAELRSAIQHHRAVSYVLAGSDDRLIRAMIGPRRPLYKMLDPLWCGAIEPAVFGRWIDARMGSAGVSSDASAAIVALAGPRTRDIIQLAHAVYPLAARSGQLELAMIATAYEQIVAAEDAPIRALWAELSPLHQNVLRAVAVGATGLTTRERRRQFALGESGAASKAARTLVERQILVKDNEAYRYDSPFMRGWVIMTTLPDAGLALPSTHQP